MIIEEIIDHQNIVTMPIESGRCNEDWTFNTHGNDWECKCSDGEQQSPIDLPRIYSLPSEKQSLFIFN